MSRRSTRMAGFTSRTGSKVGLRNTSGISCLGGPYANAVLWRFLELIKYKGFQVGP